MWSRAGVPTRRAHEVQSEGALGLETEVSKESAVGPLAVRVRDLIRQITTEHELHIISGKVARDHVHLLLSCRPHQDISTIVPWLKEISSRVLLQEFPHLRKQFWGRHFWARGTWRSAPAPSRMRWVQQYIEEQEGESPHDDSQFPIDRP